VPDEHTEELFWSAWHLRVKAIHYFFQGQITH